MTIDEIKELIRVVHETGIAELEVQRGENRVRIRQSLQTPNQDYVIAALPATLQPAAVAAPSDSRTIAQASATPAADERDVAVRSPIVGTYYDAPAPGTPPFVKVGDQVEPKQVLCIIESMKLMNEIEAEFAGTVIAKHLENGRPVEYGEALFAIRPRS
ncbi:MAG TPA: acetyl-CoA carboxylase biotin carboxyl carrier protein [Bryobacteraceae bacterium]|nr:acetyl-CoA carboxylase biotin carboxyl carrier protein [Bryobacteraceae bacterium]